MTPLRHVASVAGCRDTFRKRYKLHQPTECTGLRYGEGSRPCLEHILVEERRYHMDATITIARESQRISISNGGGKACTVLCNNGEENRADRNRQRAHRIFHAIPVHEHRPSSSRSSPAIVAIDAAITRRHGFTIRFLHRSFPRRRRPGFLPAVTLLPLAEEWSCTTGCCHAMLPPDGWSSE